MPENGTCGHSTTEEPARIDIDDPDVDLDSGQRLTYGGELFTGEAAEYAPDGTMISLVTYVKGLEDGPSLEWYPDGSPLNKGLIRRNRAVGTWQTWHPNGKLAKEEYFDQNGDSVARQRWTEQGAPLAD